MEFSGDRVGTSDRRLEQLSRRLFEASRFADLNAVLELVAGEFLADEVACQVLVEQGTQLVTVASHGWQSSDERYALADLPASRRVLSTGDALQIFISDSNADAAELHRMVAGGIKSVIKIPIGARGQTIGMLEVRSHRERSWTRSEIYRGRVISYQLGAVLDNFLRGGAKPGFQDLPRELPMRTQIMDAIGEQMRAAAR